MNQNNFYAQNPYGAMGGFQQPTMGAFSTPNGMPIYNTMQNGKQPDYTNPLGDGKIKELLQKGNGGPKLALTEEDYNRAICTHRYNKEMQVVDLGNGKVRCKICGAEFVPLDDVDYKDVEEATENLLNILHTAKMAWLDVPDKTAVEFFQSIAIVEKTPELHKIAMANFNQYNGGYNQFQTMGGAVNGFAMINQMMSPNANFGAMPQMYGQYNQPMMYGQQYDPNQMNNFGGYNPAAQQMQQAAPGLSSNGFGYNAPQPPQMMQQQSQEASAPVKGEDVHSKLHV